MLRILIGTIIAIAGVAMLMQHEWLGGSLLLVVGAAVGSERLSLEGNTSDSMGWSDGDAGSDGGCDGGGDGGGD